MSSSYQSALSSLGAGEESTYGTAVSATVWVPILSCSFQQSLERRIRDHLRVGAASYNARSRYKSRRKWAGGVELECTYDNMGIFLKHALGTVSTTGSNPYTHVYKRAASFPTGLTFTLNRGSGVKEVFEGGKINGGSISGEAGGYLKLALDCFGETATRSDTAASETFGTDAELIECHQGATLSWNSLTLNLMNFRASWRNGLVERPFVGSLYTQEPKRGERESITFEAEIEVNDQALTDYLDGDGADLSLAFTSSSKSFTIAGHNAELESVSDPIPNNVGVVRQRLRWVCLSDGTDEGLAVTVVNAESSGIANG
jgi:hypothetical protein